MNNVFGKRRPIVSEGFRKSAAALAEKVGLQGEGPGRLFPTSNDHKQLVINEHAHMTRHTQKITEYLLPLVGPQCEMVPFFLIPESCWTGESGQFLVEFLRLTPYGAWNVAYLPGNQWTSMILGTPVHPRTEVAEFSANMRKLILDSKREVAGVAETIHKTGDIDLMTAARARAIALILTSAKKVADGLSKIGKPEGPDNRAGLSFLGIARVNFGSAAPE